MSYSILKSIPTNILVSKTKELAQREREISLQIIHHLHEISDRKIYLEMGYGSMFDFVVKELKYSSGAAYRRIEAMKLLSEIPEIESKVRSGELTLTNLSMVQSVSKELKKEANEVLTKKEKLELVAKVENMSTREAEREIEHFKQVKMGTEQKPVTRVLRIELTKEMEEKIKLLKAHSHKFSNANSDQELFNEMLNQLLTQKIKIKGSNTISSPIQSLSSPKSSIKGFMKANTRYIPVKVKQELLKSSNHQCEYTNLKSKRRCENKAFLQIDHLIPVSKNGSSDQANLRVLCSSHNQWKSNRLAI